MRTLYLSAGHSAQDGIDQGAQGNGYSEGKLTSELRAMLVNELKTIGVTANVDSDYSVTGQTVRLFKTMVSGNSVAIDIHFNAATSELATGTEVLIPASATTFEKVFAADLAKKMSEVLNIKNRGVKTELESARKKLLWMEIPCENILLEVCFISNTTDIRSYQDNKSVLAKKLAELIKSYLSK
jgi:N-acetylmuramoyl-L-alanine amidase